MERKNINPSLETSVEEAAKTTLELLASEAKGFIDEDVEEKVLKYSSKLKLEASTDVELINIALEKGLAKLESDEGFELSPELDAQLIALKRLQKKSKAMLEKADIKEYFSELDEILWPKAKLKSNFKPTYCDNLDDALGSQADEEEFEGVGTAGTPGFGVGTVSDKWAEDNGFLKHAKHHDKNSEFYGVLIHKLSKGAFKVLPAFYQRIVIDLDNECDYLQNRVYISSTAQPGYYRHSLFFNDGLEVPFILRACYEASNSGGRDAKDGLVTFQAGKMSISVKDDSSYSSLRYLKGAGSSNASAMIGAIAALGEGFSPETGCVYNALDMLMKAHLTALLEKSEDKDPLSLDKKLCAWSDVAPFAPRYRAGSTPNDPNDEKVSFADDGTELHVYYEDRKFFSKTGSGSHRAKLTNTGHISGHVYGECGKDALLLELVANNNIFAFNTKKHDITKAPLALSGKYSFEADELEEAGFISLCSLYSAGGRWGKKGTSPFTEEPFSVDRLMQDSGYLKESSIGGKVSEEFRAGFVGAGDCDGVALRNNSAWGLGGCFVDNKRSYASTFRALYWPKGDEEIKEEDKLD